MDSQLEIKFFTKQIDYAIPDTVYTIPDSVEVEGLNAFINTLLKESKDVEDEKFDFLLCGELIRDTLAKHLESKDLTSESVHEIEYFVKYPAPSPENSLSHDDWVSGVDTAQQWILSSCYDNTIHIWNINGEHKLTIPGHSAPAKAVAWLKCVEDESVFVSTSFDETAILWQWNQNTNAVDCIHVCKGHTRSVDCVSVSPETNRFATGSYDQMLKIWSSDDVSETAGGDDDKKRFKTDSAKNKVKTPLMTLSGHTDGVSGVQWLDTNEIVTCGLDCTLRIWDVELGGLKSQMNGSKAFLGIAYSPLSRMLISGSSDRHIRLWDPRSKEGAVVKSVFSSHSLWVTSLAWSPVDEYQFVSGSMDSLVKLWDTRSPSTPLYDISGHEDKVFAVDWSLKDYIISGGADNHIKLYKFEESRHNRRNLQNDAMET